MTVPLPRPRFESRGTGGGFGPSRITRGLSHPLLQIALPSEDAAARKAIRAAIDDRPGVYGMIGLADELIYVGKSKALRDRLVTYLFDHEGANPKSRRIIDHTRTIVIEPAACEFVALLRELELIRRWRPRFNVQGQPGRTRQTWLCFLDTVATAATLHRQPARDALACFGPLRSGRKARAAVEQLNLYFRLRDCPIRVSMHFADQRELFDADRTAQCLRFEIGNCLGPCASGCTRGDYQRQVRQAIDFLQGRDDRCLEELSARLEQATAARRFEQAAVLHESLASLQWLSQRMEQLRGAESRTTFVYRVPHATSGESWYFVQGHQIAAVGPRPRSPRTAERWLSRLPGIAENGRGQGSMPSSWNRAADGELLELSIAATESGRIETPHDWEVAQLVSRWFREHPEERRHTLTIPEAARHCRAIIANQRDPHLELNQLVRSDV